MNKTNENKEKMMMIMKVIMIMMKSVLSSVQQEEQEEQDCSDEREVGLGIVSQVIVLRTASLLLNTAGHGRNISNGLGIRIETYRWSLVVD